MGNRNRITLTAGQRFGCWTVIGPGGRDRHGHPTWTVQCECGTVRTEMASPLTRGKTTRCRNCFEHGGGATAAYQSWKAMKSRCSNPNDPEWSRYGGRGIRICGDWNEYPAFLRDMGPRPEGHTLDRIDNDGSYEPSNCRWATHKEQNNNRGQYNNRITAFGRTQTVSQWARERGMAHATLWLRLFQYGWTAEDAISKPVRPRRKRK